MTAEDRMQRALVRIMIGAVVFVAAMFLVVAFALAHDHDHPELDQWYAGLMQPDNPAVSCCGKADAYWCDTINVKDGKTFCTITDDRDDGPLRRPHVPIGTQIEIPNHKLKWEQNGRPIGNPTGHSIVFLSVTGHVFCFVQNTGI
ncbi:MAG TPA: hypothetical protein VJ323_08505 [Bryobacteraceae bacterium]|jgi:hypothetical protein|nr:hypothetical protein [Bryobacteraceae bacterium]